MPTYEYACRACAHRLEVVQAMTDDPLTVCPECGGSLKKVFSPVGIAFKGGGFYKNDSRPASGSSTGASGSSTSGSSSAATPSSTSETSSSTSTTTAT